MFFSFHFKLCCLMSIVNVVYLHVFFICRRVPTQIGKPQSHTFKMQTAGKDDIKGPPRGAHAGVNAENNFHTNLLSINFTTDVFEFEHSKSKLLIKIKGTITNNSVDKQ